MVTLYFYGYTPAPVAGRKKKIWGERLPYPLVLYRQSRPPYRLRPDLAR